MDTLAQQEGESRRMRAPKFLLQPLVPAFAATTMLLENLPILAAHHLSYSEGCRGPRLGAGGLGAEARAKWGSHRGRRAPRETPAGARREASLGGTEVGSRAEPKGGAGGESGANRGGTQTQTDAKEVRRKEPDCQPD